MKCYLFKASLYINSYLTSEQSLHQFCLTNLFLRANPNKTDGTFFTNEIAILETGWPTLTYLINEQPCFIDFSFFAPPACSFSPLLADTF